MPKSSILIIGPLPPPIGGARISFKLFLDKIVESSTIDFKHFDLPILDFSDEKELSQVNNFRTILRLMHILFILPFSKSIVVFGSRNFVFFYGSFILFISKCFRKKCYIRFFGGRPMLALLHRNFLVHVLVLRIFKLADKILVETKFGAREFPNFLQKRIEVIPGYRTRIPKSSIKQLHDDNKIKFVYTGQIVKEKGLEILLDAYCQLKKSLQREKLIELHLYGPVKPESQNILVRLKKIDDIYYYGSVDNLILREKLPSYDIFVFPSIYDNEGHPGSLIEALFSGLPIISTDMPGIREILQHQINVLLVRAGDVNSLTAAMKRLAINQTLRLNLTHQALKSSERFDADIVIDKLLTTLDINKNYIANR